MALPYLLDHSIESAIDFVRKQPQLSDEEIRRNLGYRLQVLQDEFAGDVKRLEGQSGRYRLRAGGYRILFRLDGAKIEVYAVKQRKNAYE